MSSGRRWKTRRPRMSPGDSRMPMLEGGKYRVPHFDGKAEADAYFSGLPVTFLITIFFWDNLYRGLGPAREAMERMAGRFRWVRAGWLAWRLRISAGSLTQSS